MQETEAKVKYKGRFGQLLIYLGKYFRLFILQSDWKVLPMSAVIAAMVSLAVGRGLFVTMEGTFQGTFALACVCIWNGFFNSIQSICRERAVIKREHRAGMHITSYVAAHMIYQAFLCVCQCAITVAVLSSTGVTFPGDVVLATGSVGVFSVELFLMLFFVTYAADLMALMISAIVHSQMAAMTVMPFMLIIQLVFSGFIALPERFAGISNLMISKWAVTGLCVISDYNSKPAVMIWNKMAASSDKIDIGGGIKLKDVMDIVEQQGMRDQVLDKLGQASQRADFEATIVNMINSWMIFVVLGAAFAVISVVFLEFIDRDKR